MRLRTIVYGSIHDALRHELNRKRMVRTALIMSSEIIDSVRRESSECVFERSAFKILH